MPSYSFISLHFLELQHQNYFILYFNLGLTLGFVSLVTNYLCFFLQIYTKKEKRQQNNCNNCIYFCNNDNNNNNIN